MLVSDTAIAAGQRWHRRIHLNHPVKPHPPTHTTGREGRKQSKTNTGITTVEEGGGGGGVLGRDNLDSSKHGSPRLGVRGEGSSPGANAYGGSGCCPWHNRTRDGHGQNRLTSEESAWPPKKCSSCNSKGAGSQGNPAHRRGYHHAYPPHV